MDGTNQPRKMPNYCCLCAMPGNEPFQQHLDTLQRSDDIVHILELCLQRSLMEHEKMYYFLPTTVCNICTTIVKSMQTFIQDCRTARQKLMSTVAKEMSSALNEKSADECPSTDSMFATYECTEEKFDTDEDTEFQTKKKVTIVPDIENSEEWLIVEDGNESMISVDECRTSEDERKTVLRSESGTDRSTPQKPSQRKRVCPMCGKLFSNNATLNVHILTHTHQRDFVCSVCSREFYSKQQLNVHVESIHEKKDFVCNKCGLKCRWRKSLLRHMQLHGENPYKHQCTYCEKAFARPNQLKHHIMKHTGDRVFCDFCGVGYRYNYMLTQHKIRVHGVVVEGVKLYKANLKKKKLFENLHIASNVTQNNNIISTVTNSEQK